MLLENYRNFFKKNYTGVFGTPFSKSTNRAIINSNWNFREMGIGGLGKEISTIFRRAFVSRIYPPEFIEQFGIIQKLRILKI